MQVELPYLHLQSFWNAAEEKIQINKRGVHILLKINICPCNYILNKKSRNGLGKLQWFRRIQCVFYPCFYLVLTVILLKGNCAVCIFKHSTSSSNTQKYKGWGGGGKAVDSILSCQVFNRWRRSLGKQVKYQYKVKAFCKSQDIMESITNLATAWEQKEWLHK